MNNRDAPDDLFAAIGHAGGDALIVMPELDIVLCRIDGMEGKRAWRYSKRGRHFVNLALEYFLESVSGPGGEES